MKTDESPFIETLKADTSVVIENPGALDMPRILATMFWFNRRQKLLRKTLQAQDDGRPL